MLSKQDSALEQQPFLLVGACAHPSVLYGVSPVPSSMHPFISDPALLKKCVEWIRLMVATVTDLGDRTEGALVVGREEGRGQRPRKLTFRTGEEKEEPTGETEGLS